jgi:anti-anti-sigma factor
LSEEEKMAGVDIDRRRIDDNTVLLDVKGYLDAFSVTDFRHAAAENRTAPKLIINLDTTFLDSAGLHALVGAVRQVHDHRGKAAVVSNHPRVTRVLCTAGLDRVVTMSKTVDEAQSALETLSGELLTN